MRAARRYLLRGAVEGVRRLQDVLTRLQLGRLAVADVAQLLLQRLQLRHFLFFPGAEQGSDLLVQLHVHGEPLLHTQRGRERERGGSNETTETTQTSISGC